MELHDRLRQYNRWRRGDDSPQPDPKELGRLLDSAADRLEVLEARIPDEEWLEKFRDHLFAMREAAYEFGICDKPEDHERMMAEQLAIFAMVKELKSM